MQRTHSKIPVFESLQTHKPRATIAHALTLGSRAWGNLIFPAQACSPACTDNTVCVFWAGACLLLPVLLKHLRAGINDNNKDQLPSPNQHQLPSTFGEPSPLPALRPEPQDARRIEPWASEHFYRALPYPPSCPAPLTAFDRGRALPCCFSHTLLGLEFMRSSPPPALPIPK